MLAEQPTVTNNPDTAKGQLLHPGLAEKAELNYDGLLRMPKRILQQLWKDGLNMPEATYCMLAMYADKVGGSQELKTFDADAFIERWALYWETEKVSKKGELSHVQHEKKISHGTIAKVISSFEKKERAIAQRHDIQLKISWEA